MVWPPTRGPTKSPPPRRHHRLREFGRSRGRRRRYCSVFGTSRRGVLALGNRSACHRRSLDSGCLRSDHTTRIATKDTGRGPVDFRSRTHRVSVRARSGLGCLRSLCPGQLPGATARHPFRRARSRRTWDRSAAGLASRLRRWTRGCHLGRPAPGPVRRNRSGPTLRGCCRESVFRAAVATWQCSRKPSVAAGVGSLCAARGCAPLGVAEVRAHRRAPVGVRHHGWNGRSRFGSDCPDHPERRDPGSTLRTWSPWHSNSAGSAACSTGARWPG